MSEKTPAQASGNESPDELYQTFSARDENGDFDSAKARRILVQEGAATYKEALETPNVLLESRLQELTSSRETTGENINPHVQVSEELVRRTELLDEREAVLEGRVGELQEKVVGLEGTLQDLVASIEALRAEVAASKTTPAEKVVEDAQEELIDRSDAQAVALKDILPPKKSVRGAGGRFTGEKEEYITKDQLDQIEAHADQIRDGREEYLEGRKEDLEEALSDPEAIAAIAKEKGKVPSAIKQQLERSLDKAERELADLGVTSEETGNTETEAPSAEAEVGEEAPEAPEVSEVAPEQKELAEKQPRRVRKETNGPIERLVVYTDGTSEWVPVDKAEADENVESATEDAPESGSEDAIDHDRARELAEQFDNLDDPVQEAEYRAALVSEGLMSVEDAKNLDIEALKRLAAGEKVSSEDESTVEPEPGVAELSEEDRDKIERKLRNRKDRLEQAKKIGILGVERGSDEEAAKIEELEAEISLLEAQLVPRTTPEGTDETAEQSTETQDDPSDPEKKKKDVEKYDRERLKNLIALREEMRAKSKKLRDEGNEVEADIIDSKIVTHYNPAIKELEERVAAYDAEAKTGEAESESHEGEKAGNPTLDVLPAREDAKDKEQAEKEKSLNDAADRLARLKAERWYSRDKEAIAAAEAEYMQLAQEMGREIVNGIDDEATRQTQFAAVQVGMWEDINVRVADLRKETKYGKIIEKFGKMHPAARMAIMAGVGAGIGGAAAIAGIVTGGVGGAAVIAGAAGFAARVAKVKVATDIAGSESNKLREKGIFDKGMAKVGSVTGLARLTRWGEGRLDSRFAKREAEAMKTVDLAATLHPNEWKQDKVDAEKAKRKAELTVEKNKARSRRAMATSAAFLTGGATAGVLAAEVAGLSGQLDHQIFADPGDSDTPDTSLEDLPDRPDGAGEDGTDSGPEGDAETGDELGPIPGEYTADNIDVSYEEYLSEDKISAWAMGEKMDMTSVDTAQNDMWDLGEADPGHAGQMVQGYLTDAQKDELGLGGMTPQEVENAMHDDALRAEALNMIAEELEGDGTQVEIVDNVSGTFYNWGARPVDADGNTISIEDARANGIEDTELVQSERYLHNVSLLRVTNADGEVSYYNSECKNFLTEKPFPKVPVVNETGTEGTGTEGTGTEGTGTEGTGTEGTGEEGTGTEGTGEEGTGNETGEEGTGTEGTGEEGTGNETGEEGTGTEGTGEEGTGEETGEKPEEKDWSNHVEMEDSDGDHTYDPDTDDTPHPSESGNGTDSDSLDGNEDLATPGSKSDETAEGADPSTEGQLGDDQNEGGDNGVVEPDDKGTEAQQEADDNEVTSSTTDSDVRNEQAGLGADGRPVDTGNSGGASSENAPVAAEPVQQRAAPDPAPRPEPVVQQQQPASTAPAAEPVQQAASAPVAQPEPAPAPEPAVVAETAPAESAPSEDTGGSEPTSEDAE